MNRVMIHPSSYDKCRESVEKAFSLFPLDIKDKKVLIKPNVLRISKASEHIVTHPPLLEAVVETVRSFSPSEIVVGDNPGLLSYGDNERSFEGTGLMNAAGGCYKNLGHHMNPVNFNPDYMDEVQVSRDVLDADIFISLPKFKTHGLTVISGAIKNSYGILPGAQKAKLHKMAGNPERFHELVVDVFKLRVPDLFIMDAIVGMEGNGPASPDLREIGMILASDNAVAMDSVVARMMGLKPGALRFLQKAKADGLGDYEAGQIKIEGRLEVIPNYKIPALGGEAVAQNKMIQEFMEQRIQVTPKADPTLCTACGDCIDHCPVSAIEMKDSLPVADTHSCITCFCCQEICLEKAMTLS